jgi:hypothetical protein
VVGVEHSGSKGIHVLVQSKIFIESDTPEDVVIGTECQVCVIVEQKISSDCSVEFGGVFSYQHQLSCFVFLVLRVRDVISDLLEELKINFKVLFEEFFYDTQLISGVVPEP